jgi:hypothetical protein
MKAIVFVILLSFVSFCYASVDTRGLSEEQQAEIALQVAKMKSASGTDVQQKITQASDTAANISEKWAGVGKALAVGIVATAKELGIAANEFAVTPLGKITTALIVWNYIGKDILHLILSFVLIFIGVPTIWHVFKWIVVERVEYLEYKSWFFGIPRRKIISKETASSEAFFFPALLCGAAAVVLVITALHTIP